MIGKFIKAAAPVAGKQLLRHGAKQGKKRAVAALSMRSLGLVTGLTGIFVHMRLNKLVKTGFMVKHNLAYFTLQTNIFSTAIFAKLLGKTFRHWRQTGTLTTAQIHPTVHLSCTSYITMTMLGYWSVLAPLTGLPKNRVLWCDAMLLHTFTPLLAISDYLLFGQKGKVDKRALAPWMVYPLLYLASVKVIARFIKEPYYSFDMKGKHIDLQYPYPFLDPQVMGKKGANAVLPVLVLLYALFGRGSIALDSKLGQKID